MPLKILIVDDDECVRRAVRCVLEGLGEVRESPNAAHALSRIELERPDLIIADVSMPGMGGVALLEAAKRADPGVVVVMLSAKNDVAVAGMALERGARAYVTKPFDADELRDLARDAAQSPGAGARGASESGRPWRVACG